MGNKRLYILFILLMCMMNAHAVKVVFRLDDPTVRYDSVHSRILELFIEKNVPLSAGVIPCDRNGDAFEPDDSEYLSLLKSPMVEVCQHGFNHIETCGSIGEFVGLSQIETEERVRKGKCVLERIFSRNIVTFIPPCNAGSDELFRVIEANGFRVYSSELYTQISSRHNIALFPETLGNLMNERGIWKAAMGCVEKCKMKEAVCVVMFHAYDLPDEDAWRQLEELLDYCQTHRNIELYTFATLLESGEISNVNRYNANLLSNGLKKFVLAKGVYYSTRVCYLVHALNAVGHGFLAVLGLAILLFIKRIKERRHIHLAMCGVLILVFCMAWWHWLTPEKLLVVVLGVSVIMPFLAILNRKK